MARFSFASTSSLPVKMEKGESVVKGKDCITRIFFGIQVILIIVLVVLSVMH